MRPSSLDARFRAFADSMREDIDTRSVVTAYARWAPVYDLVFGAVFRRGSAAIEAADRIGGRILEVGVGTGLSLSEYARANRIVGVDISAPMLKKARDRVASLRLAHVEDLAVMDAERLDFPDASFDVVVAQYVVTAVPDPEAALREFARVLKPGGEIVLTSRVSAEGGLRGAIERGFAPIARRLGWRTDFAWDRYARWVEATPGIRLVELRTLPPLGQFALIRFGKSAPPSSIHAQADRSERSPG
jgi:phosphatidylethanolamine/phosphatidyl-N-methylethanolamine N-methyltransferase